MFARWRPRHWLRRPSNPARIQCRLGAVSGVECRPGCRDMPLYAAICRSLERKLLIFLGLGFFFASQLRWRSASRAKLAREPEGESRAISERRVGAQRPRGLGRPTVGFQASEARPRIPPGAPLATTPQAFDFHQSLGGCGSDLANEESASNPSRRANKLSLRKSRTSVNVSADTDSTSERSESSNPSRRASLSVPFRGVIRRGLLVIVPSEESPMSNEARSEDTYQTEIRGTGQDQRSG